MQETGSQQTLHPIVHHGTSFFKKNRIMLSVLGLVAMVVTVAGVFTSVWMTQQSNDIRSDAATDVFVDFTFGTPSQTVAVNQQGKTTIKVNTAGHKISGAALYVKYDPQYLQVLTFEKTNHFPTVLENAKIDNTAGKASIILGSSASETSAGTFEIATLTFKVLKTTTGTKFTFDASQLMATVTDNPNNVANVAGDATVMSAAITYPTAEVTVPSSSCTNNATNKKYKIGGSVVFSIKATAGNPVATESRVFIAKVDAAGTGLVNQGAEGAACLNGTGTISGPKGYWCKIGTNAITSASFAGNVTWNASVAGKFVVTTNAIVPNGTSCSGNPTCDYSTDSPFTKSSCTGFVNCSNNDWHIFEVTDAASCTVPSPSPTSTPRPSPTATPTPSPTATPAPGTPSLDLSFKLQGLKKAGIKEMATIQVKYVPKGQTASVTKTYTKEYTSDATGILKASTPLALSDIALTVGNPVAGAKVVVKVPTSLAKVVGTVTLTANQTVKLESTEVLPVGDFKHEPAAEANIIKYNDLALAVSQFKSLENPVTNDNRVYDVNFDGVYNLQDLAIVLINFDQLEYPGDTP